MAGKHKGASLLPWLGIALIVVIADQFTKALILGAFHYGETRYVTSFFNVVRVHNTGAAFSFLADAGGWQRWFFIAIGIVATIIIVRLLKRHAREPRLAFALALVLGGALGNVIDRLLHGYVVDFIQVHWKSAYYFPAFNVADSAITLGAGLLILDELLRVRRSK